MDRCTNATRNLKSAVMMPWKEDLDIPERASFFCNITRTPINFDHWPFLLGAKCELITTIPQARALWKCI
jgi:hypothetical protein